jgi:hypothetical protein
MKPGFPRGSSVNFGALLKGFDTVMVLLDTAKRLKGGGSPPPPSETGLTTTAPPPGLAGQLEARLTNVVVAALKEAFDRDHARLELERAQLEEQRRRAEEAMRAELRRQAADREIGRLRLLAGTALIGWIASVALFLARLGSATMPTRVVIALAWLLLLGALGAAFTAQARINTDRADTGASPAATAAAGAALWLLIAGLALSAISLLF